SASPTIIEAGATTTLSWSVRGSDSVKIVDNGGTTITEGRGPTGTQMVMPTETTTYTLVAANANGETRRDLLITVNSANGPHILSFTANPTTVDFNGTSTLMWSVENATGGIEIKHDNFSDTTSNDAMGSFAVHLTEETTYVLIAKGNDNATNMATVTIS